jgi:hypothetical protein
VAAVSDEHGGGGPDEDRGANTGGGFRREHHMPALRRERRSRGAEARRADDAVPVVRDMTPAVGSPASPSRWRRAREGAEVALQSRDWADSRWSFLYGRDTRYREATPSDDEVAAAARRARTGPPPPDPRGPFIKAPVWTWEVPLYFWFGGMAAGASFAAVGCEVAGDRGSARIARGVALAALLPSPPLLIADLGRPERFYKMLRIFKPRSPMSMGSWCLSAFGTLLAGATGADLLGRRRSTTAMTAATAVTGIYLGSYTAVLLAGSNVPVWARSRTALPPIFICTATATGAAATRLTLSAAGLPAGHPTRTALGAVEAGAMGLELALSSQIERRLGRIGRPLHEGRPGRLFNAARWAVRAGLALRAAGRRAGPVGDHAPSVLFALSALAFRFGWVDAGRASARDEEAIVEMARR